MADVALPILTFIGTRDEIARPAAVAAIREASPNSEVYDVRIPAGHFGLVVGGTALSKTWPTVVEWIHWRDRQGPRPVLIPAPKAPVEVDPEDEDFGTDIDFELFYDAALDTVRGAWKRLGELTEDAGGVFDSIRYQLPKLGALERLHGSSRIGLSNSLAQKARSQGDDTFFLYQGRAFTFAEADKRVDAVARGFLREGVQKGQRVGLVMASRPSFLSAVTALNRIGAVAVVLPASADDRNLARAVEVGECTLLVADPEHAVRARAAFGGSVLTLGGGADPKTLPVGVSDMEAIDPNQVVPPAWYTPSPGRARDLAMVLFSRGGDGTPKAQLVTNGRWATSAFGAAAGCTITPSDTVYCSLPLHHPTGLLVAVGSAVAAGARLAIGSPFEVDSFWTEVHRYGATVAFYAGDMIRALVDAERKPIDQKSALRLFAGSGMRLDVWERIEARFGGRIGVMEFYASTEANLVLANASGKKVGALGRTLPGSAANAVAAYDFKARDVRRDPWGRAIACGPDEPGMLLARLDRESRGGDPIVDIERLGSRVRRDLFEPGDAWFATGDIVLADRDGDFWYVDRESEVDELDGTIVSSRSIEDALHRTHGVARAVVLRQTNGAGSGFVAVVEAREGSSDIAGELRSTIARELSPGARPASLLRIGRIPLQEGFRPDLVRLRAELGKLRPIDGALP